MRLVLVAVLLALASCGQAPANSAELPGTYKLVSINDSALPVPSPGNDNAILEGMTWVLGADEWLAMTVQTRQPTSDTSRTFKAYIPYRVEGNKLIPEGDAAPAGAFQWVRRGGELRLTDNRGEEYRFVRQ